MTRPAHRLPPRGRGAFTLIELLVVITIIALLSSMLLAALYAAQEDGRRRATTATIRKLHAAIMLHWEGLRTRRLPLDMAANIDRAQFARQQLYARWMMQRFELPDRYDDIAVDGYAPLPAPRDMPASTRQALEQSAMRAIYQRRIALTLGLNPNNITMASLTQVRRRNQSSECLYMVVASMNAEDQVRLLSNEVGDTDQDGMQEILDGWGHPIGWLRWAPGYVPSLGAVTDQQVADPINAPDPFDPLGMGRPKSASSWRVRPPSGNTVYGYKLVPLLVSGGPDDNYGINFGNRPQNPQDLQRDNNPYSQYGNNPALWRGQPVGSGDEGVGGWLDNITNHMLGQR